MKKIYRCLILLTILSSGPSVWASELNLSEGMSSKNHSNFLELCSFESIAEIHTQLVINWRFAMYYLKGFSYNEIEEDVRSSSNYTRDSFLVEPTDSKEIYLVTYRDGDFSAQFKVVASNKTDSCIVRYEKF